MKSPFFLFLLFLFFLPIFFIFTLGQVSKTPVQAPALENTDTGLSQLAQKRGMQIGAAVSISPLRNDP